MNGLVLIGGHPKGIKLTSESVVDILDYPERQEQSVVLESLTNSYGNGLTSWRIIARFAKSTLGSIYG